MRRVAKLRVGKSTWRMTGDMDCTAILSTSFCSSVKSETRATPPVALGKYPVSSEAMLARPWPSVALGKDPVSPEAFGWEGCEGAGKGEVMVLAIDGTNGERGYIKTNHLRKN